MDAKTSFRGYETMLNDFYPLIDCFLPLKGG